MFKLFKYFRYKDWIMILCVIMLVIVAAICELQLPDLMGNIMKEIMLLGNDNPVLRELGDKAQIRSNGLEMLKFVGISAFANIIVAFLAAKIGAGLSQKVRSNIFKKVESLSLEEINRFSTSSLITRTTNDVTQIQQVLVMMMRIAFSAPITAGIAIYKAVNKSADLSYIIAGAVVVLISVIVTLCIIVLPKFRQMQKITDNLNLVTRENLTGIRVVRAHNTAKYEEAKFEKVNEKLTKTNVFVNNSMNLLMPTIGLIMSSVSLLVIWIGSYLVSNLKLEYEIMTIFTQYAIQVILAFMMLSMFIIFYPRAEVSAKRILEVLNTEAKIVDPANPKKEEIGKTGEVEFKNVSFRYPDASDDVLTNISFKASKGETIAFIGSTGSGKSTIINLIPRFYDVTDGEVLVNGINVKDYTQSVLHSKIGYVPQKGILFSGTIQSNLDFGKENATTEDYDKAIEISQAKEFVSKLEGKYDYAISQGGTNVSGGQRQRLSIARAILKEPEIYIFDDSFSALDYKTDKALRESLALNTKNATCLIVAQRIGTIINADKILVIDEGKVVGMGTHGELLENCEVYKEIALSQLSKEELGI